MKRFVFVLGLIVTQSIAAHAAEPAARGDQKLCVFTARGGTVSFVPVPPSTTPTQCVVAAKKLAPAMIGIDTVQLACVKADSDFSIVKYSDGVPVGDPSYGKAIWPAPDCGWEDSANKR